MRLYNMREGCSVAGFGCAAGRLLRLSTLERRVRARSLAWSIWFQKPMK
jgi:hypothetical protein